MGAGASLHSPSRGHGAALTVAAGGKDGSVRRSLERAFIRLLRGLGSQLDHWKKLAVSSTTQDSYPEGAAAEFASLDQRAKSGEVDWTFDDVCKYLAQVLQTVQDGDLVSQPPRVLNAGSGPLAPGPIQCPAMGKESAAKIPIISSDSLARFRSFQAIGGEHVALPCQLASLRQCFPDNYFDVVHVREVLGFERDPLLAIRL